MYNVSASRSIAVCLIQDDYNLKVWSFATSGAEHISAYYEYNEKTFVYIHTLPSKFTYKVAVGINWLGESETNKALALLQAIRIA